jgi:hypothetical protein
MKRQKSSVRIHHLVRWLHVHFLPTSFPMMLKARSSFSFESFCKESKNKFIGSTSNIKSIVIVIPL